MKVPTVRRQPARPTRIAVLASGTGSNFRALTEAAASGRLGSSTVELLVCDRADAPVLDLAQRAGVVARYVDPGRFGSRRAYDAELLSLLGAYTIDLVVLAGWMRVLSDVVVTPNLGRMINVHPSLLPSFPGRHAVRQALERGVKVTGVTVHYVDYGVDTGPIIAQEAVPILPGDEEGSLATRIHSVEHALLCRVISDIVAGRVVLEDGRVRLRANG